VDVQPRRQVTVDRFQETDECAAVLRGTSAATTVPKCTSNAATIEAVPCRRYSNSTRSVWPGPPNRVGCFRDRAAIAVFSSTDSTKALVGFDKYKAHTSAARSQKLRSSWAGQPTPHLMRPDIQLGQDAPYLRNGYAQLGQRLCQQR
jgi:hypothetical protein